MIASDIKKIIIVSSVGVVLLGLIALAVFVEFDLKIFKITSISSLVDKREDLVKVQNELTAQEKAYNTAITKNNTEQTSFTSEKNKYNAISDETIKIITEATTQENYNIEYMWIRLGNYATANNLTIQLAEPGNTITQTTTETTDSKSSTTTNKTTSSNSTANKTTTDTQATTNTETTTTTDTSSGGLFTVQVTGSYLDVSDFIFQVENDKELRFKLDNISMDYVEGTTIKAKFNVKNIVINK